MLGYVLPGVLYICTHQREAQEVLVDLFGKEESPETIADPNCSNITDSDIYINNYNCNDDNNDDNHNGNNMNDGDNYSYDSNDSDSKTNKSCNNDHSNRKIVDININSPSIDNEASPTHDSITSPSSVYSSETKSLVTGKKRKTVHQKFKLMSQFFMPIFLIVFGFLAAIIGVTSVFFF